MLFLPYLIVFASLSFICNTSVLDFSYYKLLIYYLNNNTLNLYIIFFFFFLYVRLGVYVTPFVFMGTLHYLQVISNSVPLTFLHSLSFGWVLLHPPYFYSSLLCLVLVIGNVFTNMFKLTNLLLVFLLSTALLLGSLWGWAANVWGFYWLYDMVELILLVIIFIVLLCMHYRFYLVKYCLCSLFFILAGLTVLRYGVFNTRHAFFSKSVVHYIPYMVLVLLSQGTNGLLIKSWKCINVNIFTSGVVLLYPVLVRYTAVFFVYFILIYFLCVGRYCLVGWGIIVQAWHNVLLYLVIFLFIFVANYIYTATDLSYVYYCSSLAYNNSYSISLWFNKITHLGAVISNQTFEKYEVTAAVRKLISNRQDFLFYYLSLLGEVKKIAPITYYLSTSIYFHDLKFFFTLVDFDFTKYHR